MRRDLAENKIKGKGIEMSKQMGWKWPRNFKWSRDISSYDTLVCFSSNFAHEKNSKLHTEEGIRELEKKPFGNILIEIMKRKTKNIKHKREWETLGMWWKSPTSMGFKSQKEWRETTWLLKTWLIIFQK